MNWYLSAREHVRKKSAVQSFSGYREENLQCILVGVGEVSHAMAPTIIEEPVILPGEGGGGNFLVGMCRTDFQKLGLGSGLSLKKEGS